MFERRLLNEQIKSVISLDMMKLFCFFLYFDSIYSAIYCNLSMKYIKIGKKEIIQK